MDIYGLLMGLALLGAIVAGLFGLALWKYFVIVLVVLVLLGSGSTRGRKTRDPQISPHSDCPLLAGPGVRHPAPRSVPVLPGP